LLKSSKPLRVPALELPHQFRQDFSLPQGVLVVHPEKGVVKKLRVDVAVGDIVSQRHDAKVRVLDYRTKRVSLSNATKPHECDVRVINPPGYLSLNSISLITSMEEGSLCVMGEEDLLVVPFLSRECRLIIYGQPGTGIVLVGSRVEMALKVLKILKPAIVQYSYETSPVVLNNEQTREDTR